MKDKLKFLLEPYKVHNKLGNSLEFLEDIIIFVLTILLFILSIFALFDIAASLFKEHIKFYDLIPKFLYIFILTELFRLMIVYLKERRVDTSLIVKTTLIAILREVIIKAPHFGLSEYVGVSVLLAVLGLMYYIPKYIFVSEEKFELRRKPQKIKARRVLKKALKTRPKTYC
ncbi:MAG: hypothetical protein GXO21_05995 [Aquificae bacterium]|nr:hypothetical protein [Aquificota bacterium]